jgi:hypothetical protein
MEAKMNPTDQQQIPAYSPDETQAIESLARRAALANGLAFLMPQAE